MTEAERDAGPERGSPWQRVRELVEGALELAPDERQAFLARACEDDAVLLRDAGILLRACEGAEASAGFLPPAGAALAAALLAPTDADGGTAAARMPPDESSAPVPPSLQAALEPRYAIERELDRGGMAIVFLARDRRHDRQVAIKVLDTSRRRGVSVERFLQEIRVTAALTHPHILPLHDSGHVAVADGAGEGPLLWYVMPYVAGETLRRRLRREPRLPVEAVRRLLREVGSALAHAHRAGIVHRDVKPENILLADGHAIVADFGIARAMTRALEPEGEAGGSGGAVRTRPGESPGTPAYMAPEQLSGDVDVDHRADLYALGLVAYEALTGEHPTGATARHAIAGGARAVREVPPIHERRADVPPMLARLVMRLLAADPAQRPESAEAMLALLDAPVRPASAGSASDAPVASAAGEARDFHRRGLYLMNAGVTPDSLAAAIGCFEKAVARDPAYAPAYAGLADAFTLRAMFAPAAAAADAVARAREYAHRSLALDPTLAGPHAALANLACSHDFAWEEAERGFRHAIALDPTHLFSHLGLALCLQAQGRFDEAIAGLEATRANDPLSPAISTVLGRIHVNARRPERALHFLDEALELSPRLDVALQQRGHALLQLGRVPEAVECMRRATELSGGRDAPQLAYALAVAGDRSAARALLEETLSPPRRALAQPFGVAMAYTGLGDVNEAFAWLDTGIERRGAFIHAVKVTPAFEPLHGDARWRALLGRIALSP